MTDDDQDSRHWFDQADHGQDLNDRPLEESVVSMLGVSTAPAAEPAFWDGLDRRLDQVDAANDTNSAYQAPASGAGRSLDLPTIEETGELRGASNSRLKGRWGFIAAAAAVVVGLVGAVWVVSQVQPSITPAGTDQLPIPSVLQAEDMIPSGNTEPESNTLTIWRGDHMESDVTFPADGDYEFVVVANGMFPRFPGPALEVRLDFVTIGEPEYIQIDRFVEYRFVGFVEAGTHQVAIASPLLTDGPESDEVFGSPGVVVDRIEIRPVE